MKSEAVQIFGSQKRIAEILQISEAAVSLWDEKIPELRAYQLKSASSFDGSKLNQNAT